MTTHLDQAQNLIRFVKQTQFNTLYLDSCGIENLNDYPELMECTHLKVLSIRSNQISDISLLSKLNNLVSLKLDNNNISDISCLKELNKLEILKISSNKISDIQSLGELTFLKELDLSFNKINQIDVLENLVRLESLNLSNNKVSDINYLSDLIELKYLNLNTNYISKVPFGVANLDMEINVWDRKNNFEGLNLYKNPLVSPPIEVLQGEKSFIIEWYNAVKGKLNEIKIILIGDPKAGKTSLLRRLKDDQFDDNEVQTDGVNIEDIEFGIAETFLDQDLIHDLTGHFWDFGGQEIMNNTHQFFLTNRSIYMLVLDARNDNNVSDQIRRWLMRIKATSGNSPIIVIANQIDVNSGFGFENEYELQQEFPQIRTFIKVSCKSSENISLLKNQLQYTINRAELIETKIDERWLKLKTELQKVTKQKYFLNETDFLETCKNLNLTLKQDQQNAIKFLNDLGLVLHFENINLSEYYVLDPYWITYGVYQILTSIYANNNNGLISMDKLDYIVNEESEKEKKYITTNHKKIIYSNNQRRFLVDILNQFKLCFYLPDQLNFIIPDLLDTNEPFEITESLRNSENCIRFVYEYNYLPKSIMPYIMVKTHLMIYAKWRTGCVLKYDGFISLISTYQNRITIIVISEDKKKSEFLAVIRHIIDSINSTLIDKPTMLIPLPGTESFVDYEELLYRRKEGEKKYVIYKPTRMIFEISLLLDGIPSFSEMNEIREKIDKVLANQENILDSVDIIANNQIEIIKKIDAEYEYLINLPSLEILRNEIVSAIEDINKNQTVEICAEIMQLIANAFELLEEDLDEKFIEAYEDIKKTDDLKLKLKLGVPLINLIGVDFAAEFDIKSWGKKMYEKYKINIFNLMGAL